MSRGNDVPVIPLNADEEESKTPETVKHRATVTVDGNEERIEESIPKISSDATPYQVLNFLSEFQLVRDNLGWKSAKVLFHRFPMHLRGHPLTVWKLQIASLTSRDKVIDFENALVAFKKELLAGYEYESQLDYMRGLRKPAGMSPGVFLMKLLDLNSLAAQLPDAPENAGLDNKQLARIYLAAMPKQWRTNFANAAKTIHNTSLAEIRLYMDMQNLADPYKPEKKDSNKESKSKGKKGKGKGNNNNNNAKEESSSSTSSGKKPPKMKPEDPCPIPGHNHPWGKCFLNRFGEHAKKGDEDAKGKGHHYNTRSKGKGENHHVESDDRDKSSDNSPSCNESHFVCQPVVDTTNTTFDLLNDPESFFLHEDAMEDEHYDGTPQQIAPPDIPDKSIDLVPSTLAVAKRINERTGKFLFKSLLDHGGSHVLINRRCLPAGTPTFTQEGMSFKTTAGGFDSSEFVYLHDVKLPEFSYTRSVKTVKAFLFNAPDVEYDIIFGRSFLNPCKIDVLSSQSKCVWFGDEIPFHTPDYFKNNSALRQVLQVDPVRVSAMTTSFLTAVKSTRADVHEIVNALSHLTNAQRSELFALLQGYAKLFDGTLGCYPHRKFTIDLKPGTVPYHCKRPYSVPHKLIPLLKQELQRQVDLGILERVYDTEWGMPMMVIPKKDGSIRTVDDLRELNKCVQRLPYPLPKIQDIFHRRVGFRFCTTLDLTSCFYSYMLDDASSWYCVLVTPFGKFRRLRLPQGLTPSPDWAQATLEKVLCDLLHDSVEVFIDDVGIFSNTWEDHVNTLSQVLSLLQANGYTVNPAKCSWCVQEVIWLGHVLTPTGIKPWRKKIEGILALDQPKTLKQLRSFLGMINYYRDFWKRRSHILTPLTALTKVSPKSFLKHWTPECAAAIKEIKAIIAQEVLLYYPDPNLPFEIETDASDYQLGAVIKQNDRPIAFFSRKLNDAQRRYPASDKEALCITEVLEEFRSLLYGSTITIFTDHKNLTQRDLSSQRLLHWRLLIEEFAPTLVYKPGENNVVADTLSRFPLSGEKQDSALLESNLAECLLYYPQNIHRFPLSFDTIQLAQQHDPTMHDLLQLDGFEQKDFFGTELIAKRSDDGNSWQIVVPDELQQQAFEWYHLVQGHSGVERLCSALRPFVFIPDLKRKVKEFISTCEHCQRNKNNSIKYGHLPARQDNAQPFEEVAVDLIGPWTINIPNTGALRIFALTMVDIATTMCEIVRIDNKTSQHVAMQFENAWLARYPRPSRCIHDPGTEFTGAPFQATLAMEAIHSVSTSAKNPQSNAICERMHKTCGDQLRTLLREQPPNNVETATELVDSVLASCVRALRTAVHRTLGLSPGTLVFGRDMLLPIPVLTDYEMIRERRQATIDDNARRANLKRRDRDYEVGEEVLITIKDPATLQERAHGPYMIEQVHVNGTVTIQRGQDVFERINIRRLRPYKRRL